MQTPETVANRPSREPREHDVVNLTLDSGADVYQFPDVGKMADADRPWHTTRWARLLAEGGTIRGHRARRRSSERSTWLMLGVLIGVLACQIIDLWRAVEMVR